MKLILILLLTFSTSANANSIDDHYVYKDTNYWFDYKHVAFSTGLNSNKIEDFYGLGGHVDFQVRFDNNRQQLGIGFENFFSLNKKKYTGIQQDYFTGQLSETSFGIRYITLAWKIEYNFYLSDPNQHKLVPRIGLNTGFLYQIQSNDYFSIQTLIEPKYTDREAGGFSIGSIFGLEYKLRRTSLYLETDLSYQFINKDITVIENHNQFVPGIKGGIIFEINGVSFFNIMTRMSSYRG